MAPYAMNVLEQEQEDMSNDTSVNELLSDDDDFFDELSSPPVISLPDILPANNSLPQLLAQSCGTSDYEGLTSVKLRVVASRTSLQRLYIYLPALVELDLSGSYLQSLRTLGYGLTSLSVLRVGRCSLDSLDGLFGVSGLQELYAPYNRISDLGLLPTLPHIRVLDLTSNAVVSLTQVSFLSLCKSLRELTLSECPVCQLPTYKASVVTSLPRLSQLDGEMLADGGLDTCRESQGGDSPDHTDGEDGATALAVERLSIQEDPDSQEQERAKICRPATVSGPRPATVSGPRTTPTVRLPERPATAAPHRQTTVINSIPECEAVSDAVSSLTSGGVVCGNLAAALRGKHRQRKPAWSTQESDKSMGICRNGLNAVPQLYTEVEDKVVSRANRGEGDVHNPLLTASQQWRQAYHSFRKAHKEQWKKEEEEGS